MAGNLKIIKNRIKSAKNIGQITTAMEMVAASKMRRAQKLALSQKPFSQIIYEMTNSLMKTSDRRLNRLLRIPGNNDKPLYIFITTNRGLCGSLNLNLFRYFSGLKLGNPTELDFIALGKKGLLFLLRFGANVVADFSDTLPFTQNTQAIIELATSRFLSGENSSVNLIYNDFINALNQKPTLKTILPLESYNNQEIPSTFTKQVLKEKVNYLIEPDAKTVFDLLLPYYLEAQVRSAIQEAEASEYSARMMAMKNASDNANELTEGLTLEYNKARQQEVTTEISDIVTAKVSMEKK